LKKFEKMSTVDWLNGKSKTSKLSDGQGSVEGGGRTLKMPRHHKSSSAVTRLLRSKGPLRENKSIELNEVKKILRKNKRERNKEETN